MNVERYPFTVSNETLTYEFYSEGPNGNIKKIIKYTKLQLDENLNIFNLGFGDWVENGIDDLAKSNNLDRLKVLATVASTIVHFTNLHAKAAVYAEGSTPARTRLYQMGITSFYEEINDIFDIFGLANEEWNLFKKGKNYAAFLVIRK